MMLYIECMDETAYKSNRNVFYACHYHVVWWTRISQEGIHYRNRRATEAEHSGGVQKSIRQTLKNLRVIPDHVHLLVSVDPQFGIHRLMKLVKGRSSRLLRQEFPVLKRKLLTLWTNSYFVSTTGGAPLSMIKQYIEQQKYV